MKWCVVLPTYDELENVKILIPQLISIGGDIIVVDDSSTDGTTEYLRTQAVTLIVRKQRGLGGALRKGLSYAKKNGYEKIITMDADLSHDPRVIPRMLEIDADVVIGSRWIEEGGIRGWPWHRRLISKVGNSIAQTIQRVDIKDCTSGFRCYSRIPRLPDEEGYAFQVQILAQMRHVEEMPIIFTDRKWGTSKLGWSDCAEFFISIIKTYIKRLL